MRWIGLLALLISGCEDPMDGPSWPGNGVSESRPTESAPDERCPAGSSEDRTVTGFVSNMTYNRAALLAEISPLTPHDGRAGACTSSDGLYVRVLMTLGGQPLGWIESHAPQEGSFSPLVEESLSVDLFGAEPPTAFGPSDWTVGSWSVTRTGDGRLEHFIDATANDGVNFVQLSASIMVP